MCKCYVLCVCVLLPDKYPRAGDRESNCLSCFPLSSGVIDQILKPPATTRGTEKVKYILFILNIMYCLLKSHPGSAVVFLFYESWSSRQFSARLSVSLTKTVGLCDPGIIDVWLERGCIFYIFEWNDSAINNYLLFIVNMMSRRDSRQKRSIKNISVQ